MGRGFRQPLQRALPEFLPAQRWFSGKDGRIERIEVSHCELQVAQHEWTLTRVRVWRVGVVQPQDYALPLAWFWAESGQTEVPDALWPCVLARVQRHTRTGLLYDAFADPRFSQALLGLMARSARLPLGGGWLRFSPTEVFGQSAGSLPAPLSVRSLGPGSSNTLLALGETWVLKAYRRLHCGINPELEMGRFLTRGAAFANTAPLAGTVEFEAADGTVTALALLQGLVTHQGDAWHSTQEYLGRVCAEARPLTQDAAARRHRDYLRFAVRLGQRIGQLHQALGKTTGDPDFDPEPVTATDLGRWLDGIGREAVMTFGQLARARDRLPKTARVLAKGLLQADGAVAAAISRMAALVPGVMKTRYHGDCHLGQVLITGEDVIIIDFEGEPARSLADRRAKHSPLRDVVGLLRSFNYATHAALRQAAVQNTHGQAARVAELGRWERQVRRAFLAAYAEAAGDSPGYPADLGQFQLWLELLTLEKACYELRYELDNRPDWVEIPLRGLCELLSLEKKDKAR